jgi:PAS domain S-box-containing protein
VAGVVLTYPDISILKKAEADLLQRATRLEWQARLLSHAPVLARDLHDRTIFWNRGAEVLYGWSEEEALNRINHELLHTRFPQTLDMIRSEVLANVYWRGELSHTTADGREVVVDSQWTRSEERRVGKECRRLCRSRWSPYH